MLTVTAGSIIAAYLCGVVLAFFWRLTKGRG